LILSSLAVLVTGSGGMIGTRLVPRLLSRGHRVVAASRQGISPPPECETVVGNLLDGNVRRLAIARLLHGNDRRMAVIHLAALSDAAQARNDGSLAFATNTLLVQQLLADCADQDIRCLVMASTGLVYANRGMAPLTEDSPMLPGSIYGATKLAAEMMVGGYARELGLRGEILRFSNVYGPGSPETTVVGRVLGQLRRGDRVSVESREPVRDFIYVDDVVDAIWGILEAEVEPGAYVTNVSSGIGTSVGALADLASASAAGHAPTACEKIQSKDALVLSNRTLRARIPWQQKFSLTDGINACLSAIKQ